MDVFRPLRAGLFIYECLRLFFLVIFIFVASMGSGLTIKGFPYLVYLSANALFPMMALFVWLKPEDHWNYLNLYLAGKIITLITFYLWQYFSSGDFRETENRAVSIFLLWGSVFVSLADMLTLWGAWILKKEFPRQLPDENARSTGPAA